MVWREDVMINSIRSLRNYAEPMSDESMCRNIGFAIILASFPFHIVLLYAMLFRNLTVMAVLFTVCEFIFAGALWSMVPKKIAYVVYATVTTIIIASLISIGG